MIGYWLISWHLLGLSAMTLCLCLTHPSRTVLDEAFCDGDSVGYGVRLNGVWCFNGYPVMCPYFIFAISFPRQHSYERIDSAIESVSPEPDEISLLIEIKCN